MPTNIDLIRSGINDGVYDVPSRLVQLSKDTQEAYGLGYYSRWNPLFMAIYLKKSWHYKAHQHRERLLSVLDVMADFVELLKLDEKKANRFADDIIRDESPVAEQKRSSRMYK